AEAPGVMVTSFMASSAGVAVLKSSAETIAAGNSATAAAAARPVIMGNPTPRANRAAGAEERHVLVQAGVHDAGVEQYELVVARGGPEREPQAARDVLDRAVVQRHDRLRDRLLRIHLVRRRERLAADDVELHAAVAQPLQRGRERDDVP